MDCQGLSRIGEGTHMGIVWLFECQSLSGGRASLWQRGKSGGDGRFVIYRGVDHIIEDIKVNVEGS